MQSPFPKDAFTWVCGVVLGQSVLRQPGAVGKVRGERRAAGRNESRQPDTAEMLGDCWQVGRTGWSSARTRSGGGRAPLIVYARNTKRAGGKFGENGSVVDARGRTVGRGRAPDGRQLSGGRHTQQGDRRTESGADRAGRRRRVGTRGRRVGGRGRAGRRTRACGCSRLSLSVHARSALSRCFNRGLNAQGYFPRGQDFRRLRIARAGGRQSSVYIQ